MGLYLGEKKVTTNFSRQGGVDSEVIDEKILNTLTELDLANITEYTDGDGEVFILPEKQPSYTTKEEFEEATKDFYKNNDDMIILFDYSSGGFYPDKIVDLVTGDTVLSKSKIMRKLRKGLVSIVLQNNSDSSDTILENIENGELEIHGGLMKPTTAKYDSYNNSLHFVVVGLGGGTWRQEIPIPSQFLTD